MTIYTVTFCTFGTNGLQQDPIAFLKRKDAEQEAKELRACGHTQVQVHKLEVK